MRKNPLCARCGEPLKPARLVYEFDLPGRPAVGWHCECAKRDPLFRLLRWKQNLTSGLQRTACIANIKRVLVEVDGRGTGRLVQNQKP